MRESSNLLDLVLIFLTVCTILKFTRYTVLKFMVGTRAAPMATGLAAFALFCWLMVSYDLFTFEDVLRGVLIYLPILTIVLLQPELKQAFISLGSRVLPGHRGQFGEGFYDEIVLAATTLASTKTGALIVIERGVGLTDLIAGGVRLDAELSYDLLVTIFNPATPLHDGAVIIHGQRVVAASCFSSITMNPRVSRELGTRHRAAISISEDTDAVVVVVSEETGLISFAQDGQIRRGLDATRLRAAILDAFESPGLLAGAFAPGTESGDEK